MSNSRYQIIIVLSITYLLVVTIIAGYAAYNIQNFNIPISNALGGITAALPAIAGVTLETARARGRHSGRKRGGGATNPRSSSTLVILFFLTIYETIIATLAGTYITPQTCTLEEQWKRMFLAKDSAAVRRIQDAFQCCGFRTPNHMAWPFPDANHGANACVESFGRRSGCLGGWRGEERRAAGMLLAVSLLVFLWQITVVVFPAGQPAWLHRVLPDQITRGDTEESREPRRQIEYQNVPERYRDETRRDEQREPDLVRGANSNVSEIEGNDRDADSGQAVAEERNEWRR